MNVTVTEKVAYLKGLMEGLEVDSTSKEGKLFHAILDTLEEIALSVDENTKVIDDLADAIDAVDEDLSLLEDDYYGEEFDDSDFAELDDEDELYEVTCPECGKTFKVSENMLDDGETVCPSCGQTLEFDLQIDSPDDDPDKDKPIQF